MDHNRQFATNNFDFDEEDDISDSLSPSDGYFSQSSQVPANLLVIDEPESESASSAKAQEASQDSPTQRYRDITPPDSPEVRRSNIIYTPSSSSHDSDHNSDRGEDHSEASLALHDPPPQYQPRRSDLVAETSPLSPRNSPGYNTMGNVGFPLPSVSNSNQPMSMSDNHGDMYDAEGATPHAVRPAWFDRKTTGGRFRRFLIHMLMVVIAIWLIVLVVKAQQKSQPLPSEHHTTPQVPVHPPIDSPPVKSISKPAVPTQSPVTSTAPESPPLPTPTSDPVNDPPVDAEGTTIIHTSRSISGRFELHDFIYMRTTSGSISVTIIIPEEWDADSTESVIDIGTTSGSIHIEFVDHNNLLIHDSLRLNALARTRRVLTTRYHSAGSGSISGRFLHGNSSTFLSHSGSITGTIHILSGSSPSHISTESTSGAQTLHLDPLDPYKYSSTYPSKPTFPPIYATHRAHGSGSIMLEYPSLWTGFLDMRTTGSGSMSVAGNRLEVIEEIRGHLRAHRHASNSREEGKVVVESFGSGSMRFTC